MRSTPTRSIVSRLVDIGIFQKGRMQTQNVSVVKIVIETIDNLVI